jgi:hypothetical protein
LKPQTAQHRAILVKQGQNCHPDYQTLCVRLSGNLPMAGATVQPDVRLRLYQAALLERQLTAQLQYLLLDRFRKLTGCGCPKIDVQA